MILLQQPSVSTINLPASPVEGFTDLVKDAVIKARRPLSPILFMFLVNCLMRRVHDPSIVNHVFEISVFASAETLNEKRIQMLELAGDAALLISGLYPELAVERNFSTTYFRFQGHGAYIDLSERLAYVGEPERGKTFAAAAENFRTLEKVLNAVRPKPESDWHAFLRFKLSLQ